MQIYMYTYIYIYIYTYRAYPRSAETSLTFKGTPRSCRSLASAEAAGAPRAQPTDEEYTKSTRAHTHRELIREWLWEPKGSSLGYI